MVTELGTELGTTLGTDLGSMDVFGAPTFDASKVYALSLGVPYYATQAGGGEAGVATGFGALYLIYPATLSASFRRLGGKLGTSDGWTLLFSSTNQPQAQAYSSTPAQVTSSIAAILGSETGMLHAMILYHTGSAINVYLDSAARVATTAITGFTPSAIAEQLGAANTGFGATGIYILGRLTFRGTPSTSDLQALLDAARSTGRLPTSMTGATITHRTSLRDTLAAANLPVADGAAGPATMADTVTGAAADVMTKSGSPIVRVIDPTVYPRTSYGVMGFSASSYLLGAAGAGFQGNLTGFTVRVPVTFWSIASGSEYFACCASTSGYQGWMLWRNTATLTFSIGTGSAQASSTKTLTSSDLGYPRLLDLVYDGSGVEGFLDGVSLGRTAGTIVLPGTRVSLGALGSGLLPAASETLHGFAGANYAATAGEVAADFIAWRSAGTLANITSGKPDANRYDFTQDVVGNGGISAGVPATVLDRVGTDHLSRNGTGLVATQRTERLWSYETTPILYGSQAPVAVPGVDYWETSTQLGETGAGSFWAAAFFAVLSQSVASQARDLLATFIGSPNRGFELRSNATNTTLAFNACDNTNVSRASPTATITSADLGKLQLFVGVYDQPALKLRSYHKRAELSTGTTVTGYAPNTSTGIRIGQWFSTALGNADGLAVYGVAGGLGLPSLAEIQAMYDATMATERIASIAGKTAFRIDLTADAVSNGGALPATLVNRDGAGFSFSKNGSPATQSQYARAFGW